jgi:hypothetical protein
LSLERPAAAAPTRSGHPASDNREHEEPGQALPQVGRVGGKAANRARSSGSSLVLRCTPPGLTAGLADQGLLAAFAVLPLLALLVTVAVWRLLLVLWSCPWGVG